MNDSQENFFSMCLRVETRLDNNLPIVSSVAALNTARTSFKNQLANIRNTDLIASKDLKGVTEDKKAVRLALVNSCIQLSSAICSYAASVNNNTLYQEIYKPQSAIEILRDDQLPTYAAQIIQRLNEFLINLSDYGVTATTISNFTNLNADYSSISSTPRVAIATRKTAKENLANQIKDTRAFLTKALDKLVKSQQDTHPVFVSEYFNDRVIYDDGTTISIIANYDGNINAGATQNLGLLPNNAKSIRLINGNLAILEIGLSVDGSTFNGNTSTLGSSGTIELEIEDFNSTGNNILLRNQSTGISGAYKVQVLR